MTALYNTTHYAHPGKLAAAPCEYGAQISMAIAAPSPFVRDVERAADNATEYQRIFTQHSTGFALSPMSSPSLSPLSSSVSTSAYSSTSSASPPFLSLDEPHNYLPTTQHALSNCLDLQARYAVSLHACNDTTLDGLDPLAFAYFNNDSIMSEAETTIIERLMCDATLLAKVNSEVASLQNTFISLVSKTANIYRRQQQLPYQVVEFEQMRLVIADLSKRFCAARHAIMQRHLLSANICAQQVDNATTISDEMQDSTATVVSARTVTFKSSRRRRVAASKRVVDPLKRSYFDKRSTRCLREWLGRHWDDPYPSASDKQSMADETGLTYDQVQHWFINFRMRVWRPTLRRAKMEAEGQSTETTNTREIKVRSTRQRR